MKIEIEKNDFIKIVIIVAVCIFICILFYAILVCVKISNDREESFNEEMNMIQEEMKEIFLEEYKIVPQNGHFLSRVYDGQISTSNVCEKIYELVIKEVPKIYNLKGKTDSELEQYYNENEKDIKNIFEVSNKDEYIRIVKKIWELENLNYVNSNYNFSEYMQGDTYDTVDLEIEFANSKLVFKLFLENEKSQTQDGITFGLK